MQGKGNSVASSRRFRVSATAFLAVAAIVLFGLASAPPSIAQSSGQNSAAAAPALEYEVATIKPYKPGSGDAPGVIRMGIMNAPDAFSATGVTVKDLVQTAYGVMPYQVSGGPDWFNSDRLEIDAKMDSAVADALKKMSPEERTLARQKMLQALLADRFKLTIQRETKELPVYTLLLGKNGSKLVEAKVDDTAPSSPPQGSPGRGGFGGPNTIMMGFDAGAFTMTGKAVPITNLVRNLSMNLRRSVVDKTGLTGKYDFTLRFAPDMSMAVQTPPPGGAIDGASPIGTASDSTAPTLVVAIQEQLGLKLESTKGPVEIIVINHVEKASDN